jgi:hypothetical protein
MICKHTIQDIAREEFPTVCWNSIIQLLNWYDRVYGEGEDSQPEYLIILIKYSIGS